MVTVDFAVLKKQHVALMNVLAGQAREQDIQLLEGLDSMLSFILQEIERPGRTGVMLAQHTGKIIECSYLEKGLMDDHATKT